MSETLPEAVMPLPEGQRAPGDGFAWVIALSPLVLYAISIGAIVLQFPLSNGLNNAISIGIYAGLIGADRRMLLAAGLTRRPSLWWFLLSPGYLWQRASILKRSRVAFWVMLGGIAGVVALQFLVVPRYANRLLTLTGQMSCDIGKPDVLRLFDGLPGVKQAGITGQSIDDVQQVSNSPAERVCKGVIHGSDGKHYPTEYTNSTSDQGPYIRIVVHTAAEP